MIQNFLTGAQYVAAGLRAFYKDRAAWKYAALPMGLMLILYAFMMWGVFALGQWFQTWLHARLEALPAWLGWLDVLLAPLTVLLGLILALTLVISTACTLYEMCGGFFFDRLSAYFETKKYHTILPDPGRGVAVKFVWTSFCYGLGTLLWFAVGFVFSLFFPVVGQILLILLMGYRFGITYMLSACGNRGMTLRALRGLAGRRKSLVLGFGATTYLLLLIPFSTLFLLPGLILGGTALFHDINEDAGRLNP